MTVRDSALDPLAMARARRLLATPVRRPRGAWAPMAAAAFAAAGALVLAGAMILVPPAKPAQTERQDS